jgi:hypothetical protein
MPFFSLTQWSRHFSHNSFCPPNNYHGVVVIPHYRWEIEAWRVWWFTHTLTYKGCSQDSNSDLQITHKRIQLSAKAKQNTSLVTVLSGQWEYKKVYFLPLQPSKISTVNTYLFLAHKQTWVHICYSALICCTNSTYISGSFFFFSSNEDWIQGLVIAGQVLYLLSCTPSHFAFSFQRGSRTNFAQVSLGLWSSYLCLQSSWDYRCAYHTWLRYIS